VMPRRTPRLPFAERAGSSCAYSCRHLALRAVACVGASVTTRSIAGMTSSMGRRVRTVTRPCTACRSRSGSRVRARSTSGVRSRSSRRHSRAPAPRRRARSSATRRPGSGCERRARPTAPRRGTARRRRPCLNIAVLFGLDDRRREFDLHAGLTSLPSRAADTPPRQTPEATRRHLESGDRATRVTTSPSVSFTSMTRPAALATTVDCVSIFFCSSSSSRRVSLTCIPSHICVPLASAWSRAR